MALDRRVGEHPTSIPTTEPSILINLAIPFCGHALADNRDLRGSDQIHLPVDLAAHPKKKTSSQVAFDLFSPDRNLVLGMVLDAAESGIGHSV